MSEKVLAKMMKDVLFKNYLGDVKEASPYKVTLYKQFAFSGVVNPCHSATFVMIGDLAKWCSLKPGACLN